ncbi:sex-determining protein fem-1, partial [Colletotrichum incanum]
MLLDSGKANVNLTDTKYGQTPLGWAAEYGHEAVVKMLLHADGTDINSNDNAGRTPLSWAAMKGHVEVVSLLGNNHAANVNSEDKEGFTPFMRAVWRFNKE